MKKIILLILIMPTILFAQKQVTWDYPIKPGTEEWKKIKSNEDRIAFCQIPDDIVKTINTKDLVDVCMQYPLYYIVISSKNVIEGLKELEKNFNGITELTSRNDCFKILLKKYNQLEITAGQLTEQQQIKLVGESWKLELLILYCLINKSGAISISHEFLIESYSKYEAKKDNPALFSSYSYQIPLYILAKLLSENDKEEYSKLSMENFDLDRFMKTCDLQSKKTENEIYNLAYSYINKIY